MVVDDRARLDRVRQPHDLEQVRGAAREHGEPVRAVARHVGALEHLAHALDVGAQRLALVVAEAFDLSTLCAAAVTTELTSVARAAGVANSLGSRLKKTERTRPRSGRSSASRRRRPRVIVLAAIRRGYPGPAAAEPAPSAAKRRISSAREWMSSLR